MKLKKMFYVILGFVGVALGAVGAVLPLLPSVPFLIIAAFSFARSSERLDSWFKETRLYKENLEDYVKGKGMRKKVKVRIMIAITFLMSIGFILMGLKGVYIGCMILAFIWLVHIVYFLFKVKTIVD